MLRTITISLYSTVKSAPFKMASISVSYPLVRNRSDRSTRSGVWRNPSRSGSSPRSASSWRMRSCIIASYLTVVALLAGASSAAAVQVAAPATESPDELYKDRENIASAKRAADLWQARANAGKDYEASWKLARACYWIGTEA